MVRILLAALLGLLVLDPVPARAQTAAPPPATSSAVVDELAGIHQALERLVGLLEQVRQHQEVELLIRRIELRERRLTPLENRVESAESAVQGLTAEIKRLRDMLSHEEDLLQEEIRAGTDTPDSDTRRMIGELRRVLDTQTSMLELESLRLRQLEDQLADGREEVEILDEMLLEMLE